MLGTVLVVDDQGGARRALAAELEDAGFSVIEAQDGREAWERFCEARPDLVITDMVMPRSDGIELLGRIRARSDIPVIMFTAYGTVESAVSALKCGADDFVSSSDRGADDLVDLVRAALARALPHRPPRELTTRLAGPSAAMARVREKILGLAPLRVPVLVRGERGTGRDTVVRSLHELGSTGGAELRVIDPGAPKPTAPVTAEAVYLDGIERLAPQALSYWAGWIAESARLGFRGPPRVFASTERTRSALRETAESDLEAALRRFEIELPPLRERAEDIPEISRALLEGIGGRVGRTRIRLSADVAAFLGAQRWPGNVGELEQILTKAVAFSRSGHLRRNDLEWVLGELELSVDRIRAEHEARERTELVAALHRAHGNIARAAEMMKRSRSAVYRLLAKHGVRLDHV